MKAFGSAISNKGNIAKNYIVDSSKEVASVISEAGIEIKVY